MSEVVIRLGLKSRTGSFGDIRKHIERLQLDVSHFKRQYWGGQKKPPNEVAEDLLPLLREGVFVCALRDRLIAAGIKEARCEECGLTKWQGKPAPLQVDHVDGDRKNCKLENLRILCANCHMQTETWGFKNGRRRPQARVA